MVDLRWLSVLLCLGTLMYCTLAETGSGGQGAGYCDAKSEKCPPPSAQSAGEGSTPKPPNIVMVVIDDLGWNDMGYSGAEYSTPNIDGVAAESLRLSQYYVQATCSPSRAALMSGRYPYRDGLVRRVITNGCPLALPLEHVTLANALQQAGYATHAIGKWDLGMHTWNHTPTRRGFDSFLGHYNAYIDHFTFDTFAINLPKGHAPVVGRDLHWNEEPATNITEGYSTVVFGNRAVHIVQSHDFSKPLFLYIAHSAVHGPLEFPPQYADTERCRKVSPESRKAFCTMAQVLDDTIGTLVSALRAENAWENTVFVFTTDNGGQASEGSSNFPLRGNKKTAFEGGVRGSAFVRFPGMADDLKGSHSHALMHISDWFPTLVEGVGGLKTASIPGLQEQDGVNCWPAIANGSASPRKEILLNLDPPADDYIGQAALRFDNWKLIVGLPNCSAKSIEPNDPGGICPSGWMRPGEPEVEPMPNPSRVWLFDMDADPEENNDLSEQLPSVVSLMQEKLAKYPPVVQLMPVFDERSDPKNFNGYWTPWLPDTDI